MKKVVPAVLCIIVLVGSFHFGIEAADSGKGSDAPALRPVEDDVHEFMEYAFEPFFHDLRGAISNPPANKKAWIPVKANSLILAENGNLLMLRGPEENSSTWNELSVALREEGKLLYQAAKKRDYDAAKVHYEKFVTKCNACHQQFADGEHMQKAWQ